MSGEVGSGSPAQRRAELYAPFRPRLARTVTLAMAVVVLVLTVALMVALPHLVPVYGVPDLIGIAILGALISGFCWRQATVSARVDPAGITVRNLLVRRRLEWAEVVSVRFGNGRPWVQLDLSDGDTLAVMGIQRADGVRSEQEASRLATLVALHSQTPRDD